MAREVTIEVEFHDDGKIRIEGKGFVGTECLKETEKLEQALGTVTHRTKKAEGYQTQAGAKQTVGYKK